jgi:hypothetical protein
LSCTEAKSDEIGAFPHEKSCLSLFFLVVEREHAKHNRKLVAKTHDSNHLEGISYETAEKLAKFIT